MPRPAFASGAVARPANRAKAVTAARGRPIRSIACVGEVMIELSPAGADTARVGVAGDTYNTAVYLRRALPGAVEVAYVTALGDEAMSARILDALGNEGLSDRLVERRRGAVPGLYAISLDQSGERSFTYWRSTSAARTLFTPPCRVDLAALDGFDLVYLSGISLAILPPDVRTRLAEWIDAYRARGGQIAFDSNYRPRLWPDAATAQAAMMALWQRTDVALPSLDDEEALFGAEGETAVRARLRSAGVAFGALKRGASGPRAVDDGGQGLAVTPVVDVVDTTAAGDSFNAGFLAAYAGGADLTAAMAAGHALSAEVIRHPGAILPKPA